MTHPIPSNHGNQSRNEADLLARLKAGESQAWGEFTEQYTPKLFTFLAGQLPDLEAVEDVLSETLFAIVKNIRTFQGNTPLHTFILALGQENIADFWRKHLAKATNTSKRDGAAAQLPESFAPTNVDFQQILARLSQLDQQLLMLRYNKGLRIGEIAKQLKSTEESTQQQLNQARQQLRQLLIDEDSSTASPPTIPAPLLQSAISMLLAQQQQYTSLGLLHEATLFARSAQSLADLSILQPSARPISKQRNELSEAEPPTNASST